MNSNEKGEAPDVGQATRRGYPSALAAVQLGRRPPTVASASMTGPAPKPDGPTASGGPRAPASSALSATGVRRWCRAALVGLGEARAEIDALNVYPVPDGDTGTNLYLTMESAVEALGPESDDETAELAATSRAVAHGALLGARGNSGVILSQYFRAVAEVLADPTPRTAAEMLRLALREASEAGYTAVAQPVEGTILSVVRGAAEAAGAVETNAVDEVAVAAASGAQAALDRTPDQLEALRRAGVVDAGGRGAVVLLDALVQVVTGSEPRHRPRSQNLPTFARGELVDPGGPAYEVMYLLEAPDAPIVVLRESLQGLGDSLLVVGGDGLWNVHVHVDDVGAAIEAGIEAGRPYRIVVTHFRDQVAAAKPQGDAPRCVVAVAAGEGLAALYETAGAAVVHSGVGAKPATRDILRAIQRAHATEVVVLPHDKDVLAVAEAAADQARKDGVRVAVIPTLATVQVLAALAVHDPGRRFDDDVVAMTSAARATRHAEVTLATREALTTAGVCQPGDVLGLLDGDVAVIGADVSEVAKTLLERMLASGGELVTVVTGAEAGTHLAAQLIDHLRRGHPEVEASVYDGGQTHFPLLLGVE